MISDHIHIEYKTEFKYNIKNLSLIQFNQNIVRELISEVGSVNNK